MIQKWPFVTGVPFIRGWLAICIGIVAGTVVCTIGWRAVQDSRPILYEDASTPESVVNGLGFVVQLKLTTDRKCPGTVTRVLWRFVPASNGGNLPQVVGVRGPDNPVANSAGPDFQIILPRPLELPPGDWHYQSRTTYSCSWVTWFTGPETRISPDIMLHFLPLVAAGAKPP